MTNDAEQVAAVDGKAAGEANASDRLEDIAQAELDKLPKINLGALFLPALWGPTHGFMITLLFYPIWVFVDSCIRAAVVTPSALSITIAAVVLAATLGFTVFFASTCEPASYLKQAKKKSVDRYLKTERIWAIVCLVLAIVAICLGTWYNLAIYLPNHM